MRTSIFQNSNEYIVRISALKDFIASLGLPGSFLGLHVGLHIYDIAHIVSPQKAQKSFQEAPSRAVVSGGAGGALASPEFGSSVNPIPTRGGRLCPPHYC